MDNHEVIKKIGSGSFADTFLINKNKNKFVLKKFKNNCLSEARREFLFLNSIKEANIVKAISYNEFDDSNTPELILEYIQGNPLDSVKISEHKKIRDIVKNISIALAKIHSTGICYNDLKAENIIMNVNEKPVLIDFGLASVSNYNDNKLRGTISYCSPEKLQFCSNNPESDIFALGILYYFLVFGHTPADKYSLNDYKKILLNKNKWEVFLNDLNNYPVMQKMLDFSSLERPSCYQIAEKLKEKNENITTNYSFYNFKTKVFDSQIEAAKTLLKNGKLNCNFTDEPDKIIKIAVLLAETANKRLYILKEEDVLLKPKIIDSLLKDTSSLPKSILIKYQSKKFPEHLGVKRFRNVEFYYLYESDKSDILPIQKNELKKILKSYSIQKNLSEQILFESKKYKPYVLRSKLLETLSNTTTEQANPLTDFLCFVKLPIPYMLITKLWKNWYDLLQTAISLNQVGIDDDKIVYTGNDYLEKFDTSFIIKAIELSNKENYFMICSILSLKIGDIQESFNFWKKQIKYLSQKEYYFSAYEFFRWGQRQFEEALFDYNLRKREAFLSRICGFPDKSIEKYKKLLNTVNSDQKALLMVDMAIAYQDIKQFEKAIYLYKDAIVYFEKHNNIKALSRTRNNLATIYFSLKQFKNAKIIFESVLETSELENNEILFTFACFNLANVHYHLGEWKKSLYYTNKTSRNSEKKEKSLFLIQSELLKALNYIGLGEYDKSLQILEQLRKQKELKEDLGLYSEVLAKMHFLSLFVPVENLDLVIEDLGTYGEKSPEAAKELFFLHYNKRAVSRAKEQIREINEDEQVIFKHFLDGNFTELVQELRKITSDIPECGYFLIQLIRNGIYDNDPVIRSEVHDLATIITFSPFLDRLKKDEKPETPTQLPVLWEVISQIFSEVDFSKTMHSILAGIIRVGKMERAIFFDFRSGSLQAVQGVGIDFRDLELEKVQVSKTILKETIQFGKVRFLQNLQDEISTDIHSSIFGLGLRTAVTYPIIINHEIKGVIYSDAKADRNFSSDEQRIMEVIFQQASSALEKSQLYSDLIQEAENLKAGFNNVFSNIIGQSKEIQNMFTMMKMVGKHNVNVLITGPTGSGKELVAKALHSEYSKKAPFVAVNCAAIPSELLESELFGFVKGAFTGALTNKRGKIELADSGTLFLDEIGDMSIELQAKLLRVIQERMVVPVGSEEPRPVNIRVICATHRNLEDLVNNNTFREDLYYRLKVIEIKVPPLSKRIDDIPLLIDFFIKKYNGKFGKKIMGISKQVLHHLQSKQWKGNIRELENEIEKAVLLCQGNIIDIDIFGYQDKNIIVKTPEELPEDWQEYRNYKNNLISKLDRRYIEKLLKKVDNNVSKASKLGGLTRKQIYDILKP